jgi:hypothetical protein
MQFLSAVNFNKLPGKLVRILTGTKLFAKAPHIYLGSVVEINPGHFGWVREDLLGIRHCLKPLNENSHSRRLEILGRFIDRRGYRNNDGKDVHREAITENLTPADFKKSGTGRVYAIRSAVLDSTMESS